MSKYFQIGNKYIVYSLTFISTEIVTFVADHWFFIDAGKTFLRNKYPSSEAPRDN